MRNPPGSGKSTARARRAFAGSLLVLLSVTGCAEPWVRRPAASANPPAASAAAREQDAVSMPSAILYSLGPGDQIRVSVMRHPELSMDEITVRPDGRISYPGLEQSRVVGLTPEALEEQIRQALKKRLRDPKVSVNVLRVSRQVALVLGEVQAPGVYPLQGHERVLDIVGFGGGFKDSADLSSVILVRQGSTGGPQARRLNVSGFMTGQPADANAVLLPKDIVLVPKSFISKVDTFVEQYFGRVDPAIDFWLDAMDARYYRRYAPSRSR